MTKPKSKHPLTSFNPALLDALIQGGLKPISFKCADEKEAIHYRHRLNSLRSAMRRENRPDWEQFYRAGIFIDPKDPTVVIIRPRDWQFLEVIKAAGVQVTGEEGPIVQAPPLDARPASDDEVEKFLKDLRNLK